MAKSKASPVDDFDLPDLPTEAESVQLDVSAPEDAFDYDVAFNMGFVGIGQAGSRIAEAFYNTGYRRVCVIDGPVQDLADVSENIPKLNLGTGGSGKDIEYGAASVRNKDQQIWELMERSLGQECDYVFVCAALSGGTGSGAITHVLAQAHRYMQGTKRPARVGCIVALPMRAEGQRFARNALTTFRRIRQLSIPISPMIIIDNQRVQELFPVGVTRIYDKCNQQTVSLFHVFNRLAAQRSKLITLDRSDLGSILDKGIVTFGAAPIRDFDSASAVSEAIRTQLERTALAAVDLKTGREAGCIFVGCEPTLDSVPMDFLDGGFNMLTRLLREGATIHRGVYKGAASGLRCFTLLAGLDPPAQRLKELAAIAQLSEASDIATFLNVDD